MREEREKKKGGREINVDEEANRREDKWSGRWRKIDDRRKQKKVMIQVRRKRRRQTE